MPHRIPWPRLSMNIWPATVSMPIRLVRCCAVNFPNRSRSTRWSCPRATAKLSTPSLSVLQPPDLSADRRWKAYTAYLGHVIEAPEEAADVRGAVTSDYQDYLEKNWVEALHSRYPVKINKKVLKKVK